MPKMRMAITRLIGRVKLRSINLIFFVTLFSFLGRENVNVIDGGKAKEKLRTSKNMVLHILFKAKKINTIEIRNQTFNIIRIIKLIPKLKKLKNIWPGV